MTDVGSEISAPERGSVWTDCMSVPVRDASRLSVSISASAFSSMIFSVSSSEQDGRVTVKRMWFKNSMISTPAM